jgi:hypothetical protein
VSGPPAFAEDGWGKIKIGDLRLRVVKPCSRCKVPNTDIETAEVGVEPGNTLKTFRYAEIEGLEWTRGGRRCR